MTDFCAIPTASHKYFSQRYSKGQVRTEFEDGTVQSRARVTRGRWTFNLGWVALSQTNYTTLQSFFSAYIGTTFNWTHPVTSTVHVVRFGSDVLPDARPSARSGGYPAWDLQGLILEEA